MRPCPLRRQRLRQHQYRLKMCGHRGSQYERIAPQQCANSIGRCKWRRRRQDAHAYILRKLYHLLCKNPFFPARNLPACGASGRADWCPLLQDLKQIERRDPKEKGQGMASHDASRGLQVIEWRHIGLWLTHQCTARAVSNQAKLSVNVICGPGGGIPTQSSKQVARVRVL